MTGMPDAFPHDGFGDAAAAARSEWRADEDAWARAALERWSHRRTLLDVARECMHRGDTVAVGFPHHAFSGRIVAVGDDVFSLDVAESRVDVAATHDARFVLRIAARARSGGVRGVAVTTIRARLLELETAGYDVELGCATGETIAGLVGVGRDHVVVRPPDAADTVMPVGALAWIRTGALSRR
jgi:hypothetical protein